MIPLAIEIPGEWLAGALAVATSVVGTGVAVIRYLYAELREARVLLVARTDAHAAELSKTQDVTLSEVKAASVRETASRAEFTSALEDQGDAVRDMGALLRDLVELTQRVHDLVVAVEAELRRGRKGDKR